MTWVALDQLHHILVPSHNECHDDVATQYASQLAEKCGARLSRLRVNSDEASVRRLEGFNAYERLHDVLSMPLNASRCTPSFSKTTAPSVEIETCGDSLQRVLVKTGDFATEIKRFCEQDPVDLIVVTARSRDRFPGTQREDLLDQLQRSIPCPVIAVPANWNTTKHRQGALPTWNPRDRHADNPHPLKTHCRSYP